MASKSAQGEQVSSEAIEEMLDVVDKTLDRVKTLYEQYFLGIQKQAPSHLHTDVERKLRDLTQIQIRNTGLRYRLATLQQKFGAYNSYWKRTLRQIENGTYLRNLSKIGREAARSGAEIPEEILAAMPKRMREQVMRDREQALAAAKRRANDTEQQLEPPDADEAAAMINEPSQLRRDLKTQSGAYVIEDDDADLDVASFFASIEQDSAPAAPPKRPPTPAPVEAAKPEPPARPTPTNVPPARPTPTNMPPPAARAATMGPAPVKRPISATQMPTTAIPKIAPSQTTRPNPVAPGAAAAKGSVPVESMSGPFPRPTPTKVPAPGPRLPPGMTDADVNSLYQKYVQAKQLVGEAAGPGAREKILKTINSQAPKIMEQYKAKAVDFSVVVKDNQVIIRAKPKL